MRANWGKPIYGFWARNENYGPGECFVQFYRSKFWRDRAAAKHSAFEVVKFETMLPKTEGAYVPWKRRHLVAGGERGGLSLGALPKEGNA